ncbi:DUF3017 domain-containing protein [Streptomyces sp. NPDC003016]
MAAGTSPDDPAATGDAAVEAVARDTEGTGAAEEAPGTDEPRGSQEPRDAEEAEPTAKGVVSAPGPDGPVRTTRRFPMFTRDTARPEGGERAASGDAAAPVRQWPFLTVLGTTGLGLFLVAVDAFDIGFRIGTLLIGLALISGAVMRRLVPSVGMLAVRSRFTDMATYGLLGTVIVLLAMMAQPGPWLEFPFLEAAVRFTVR